MYDELVARRSAGRLSFAGVRAVLLDEYVGLPPGHPESYAPYIASVFTSRVEFDRGAVQGPDGSAADLVAAAAAYEAAIEAAGGVDVQLLGIGADGHIGVNEPGSSLASRTRLKTLTQPTRVDNARFFGSPDDVPRHVITEGVGTILNARHLVLVAWGAGKAAAVAVAVDGPVTAMVPASALQLHACERRLDGPAAATFGSPTTTGRRTPRSRRGKASDGVTTRTRRRKTFRGTFSGARSRPSVLGVSPSVLGSRSRSSCLALGAQVSRSVVGATVGARRHDCSPIGRSPRALPAAVGRRFGRPPPRRVADSRCRSRSWCRSASNSTRTTPRITSAPRTRRSVRAISRLTRNESAKRCGSRSLSRPASIQAPNDARNVPVGLRRRAFAPKIVPLPFSRCGGASRRLPR